MDSPGTALRRGKKIIFTSPFVPAEWIAAHGLVPWRMTSGGSAFCGGSGAPPVSVESGVCAYMRGFINEAVSDPQVLGVVLVTTCDQMRRGADLINLRTKVPCFLMNVPSTCGTPEVSALYAAELERLGRFCVTLGGKRVEPERLVSILLEYDINRRMVLARQNDLSAGDFARELQFFGENGKVRDENFAGLACGRPYAGSVPVGFIGGPLTARQFDLFDVFADHGAEVVFNGTESGERAFPARLDLRRIKEDPTGVLTEAYFRAIPDVFQRPNSGIFAWMEKAVRSRQVRGVVFVRHLWCDKWHAEAERFRAALEVPLLDIELDGGRMNERVRNRIGAFMEGLR
ncbi:MAG: 2-hydroxyacyl-CoA dehydratase [Candidatus Omnitrophica bacterium]|nr:2-hydroxyacyl-CoA dehydratase [Candidatus Omnitrophota bacterium]